MTSNQTCCPPLLYQATKPLIVVAIFRHLLFCLHTYENKKRVVQNRDLVLLINRAVLE